MHILVKATNMVATAGLLEPRLLTGCHGRHDNVSLLLSQLEGKRAIKNIAGKRQVQGLTVKAHMASSHLHADGRSAMPLVTTVKILTVNHKPEVETAAECNPDIDQVDNIDESDIGHGASRMHTSVQIEADNSHGHVQRENTDRKDKSHGGSDHHHDHSHLHHDHEHDDQHHREHQDHKDYHEDHDHEHHDLQHHSAHHGHEHHHGDKEHHDDQHHSADHDHQHHHGVHDHEHHDNEQHHEHHHHAHVHAHHHAAETNRKDKKSGKSTSRGSVSGLFRVSSQWRPRNPPMQRGAGQGKVLFVDSYTAGVAGDMFVAALLDLGVPAGVLGEGLSKLGLQNYWCEVVPTERSAIVAPRFVVKEERAQPFRDYAVIKDLLANAELPPGALSIATRAFALLAEAEASVHGVDVDSVHFHEVGAVDSIVDIVAASLAVDFLGASSVVSSPLPMGRGIIRGAAHGPLPSPAPATLSVLCRCQLATFDAGSAGELVTPTGACLVGALASSSSPWPPMRPIACSYGAGTKVRVERPNLLRLVLGKPL